MPLGCRGIVADGDLALRRERLRRGRDTDGKVVASEGEGVAIECERREGEQGDQRS